jgi:hypothetical protein
VGIAEDGPRPLISSGEPNGNETTGAAVITGSVALKLVDRPGTARAVNHGRIATASIPTRATSERAAGLAKQRTTPTAITARMSA